MMAWRAGGMAIGLIVGIVAAAQGLAPAPVYLWALAAVGVATTVASLIAERRWSPWPALVVAAAMFCCTLPLGFTRTMHVIGPPVEGSLRHIMQTVEPGTPLHVRGHVSAEPELRGAGELDLYVRVQEIRFGGDEPAVWTPVSSGRLLVRAYSRAEDPSDVHAYFNRLAAPAAYGWQLEIRATYRPIERPLNPGQFDYAYFLRQSGVDIRLRDHVTEVTVLEESRGNPVMALALAAKTSFLETFKDTVRAPASRLTSAATLGARRAVENVDYRGQDLATTLRHAGVGHVLAVSGLHVSVIAVMLFALFRMTGAKPKQFVPVLIVFLILFALLTGARPSSVRAVIMNSVVLISIAYLRVGFRSATVIGLSLSSFFILVRNPTVLFAPSFLLSYGAVLSLIVIAPPLDRFICKLRGFTLFFAALWFAMLLRLAGWHLPWLLQPFNLFAYIGVLWLMILIGTRLNHRFPVMWKLSLERIPALVRLFFAAQLAIQFGMMIPLSAWFFGLFPVAGVLVNLLAIPAVGVLVQLGMLTGLIGLIPGIGAWLAIPFGAATTLTGDAFILMAYAGSSVFPYPATPMPTTLWMGLYYTLLAAILLLEGKRAWLLGWLYRLVPPGPAGGARRFTMLIPVLLILLPFLHSPPSETELREVRILAEGRYPIVLLTGPRNATLINAGGRFTGGRLVFNSLRQQGAMRVDTAILPSPDPRVGIAGAIELLERMPIFTGLLGILPDPGQSMPEAIGDDYLINQVAADAFWAVNIEEGFEDLRERAKEHGMRMAAIANETLPTWRNATLRTLPMLEEMPRSFVSSARTPILHASIHGLDWIIITDTTRDAVSAALADITSCDILVVPNLSTFRSYGPWLRIALIETRPRVLIIAGDRVIDDDELESLLPYDANRILIQTADEGAVSARLLADGETRLETYRGNTRLSVRPE